MYAKTVSNIDFSIVGIRKKSLNDKICKIVKLFIFNKLLFYKIVYNNVLINLNIKINHSLIHVLLAGNNSLELDNSSEYFTYLYTTLTTATSRK